MSVRYSEGKENIKRFINKINSENWSILPELRVCSRKWYGRYESEKVREKLSGNKVRFKSQPQALALEHRAMTMKIKGIGTK